MKTITEKNYHENTTALFRVVESEKEINEIMALEPIYINDRFFTGRKWRANPDDYDFYRFFDEEDKDDLKNYQDEINYGAIGVCSDEEVNNGNDFFIIETFDADEDEQTALFTDRIEYKLTSKTWLVNGIVYRYASYWGKLGSCNWDLDTPNYEQGEQHKFVLAKCDLKNFKNKITDNYYDFGELILEVDEFKKDGWKEREEQGMVYISFWGYCDEHSREIIKIKPNPNYK